MQQNLIKPLALKRIQLDYEDLLLNPLKGAGIIRPDDNNPFHFIINVRLMTGCYEGIILQLSMEVPNTFPKNPPKVLIFPTLWAFRNPPFLVTSFITISLKNINKDIACFALIY